MKIRWPIPAALVVAFSLGCSAQVASNLTVNGAHFDALDCSSGVPMGYSGVELEGADGTRLRLVSENGSGKAIVHVFAPGAIAATATLNDCGTLEITQQNSEINGVKNVKGAATLSCSDGTHTIAGDATFENCH